MTPDTSRLKEASWGVIEATHGNADEAGLSAAETELASALDDLTAGDVWEIVLAAEDNTSRAERLREQFRAERDKATANGRHDAAAAYSWACVLITREFHLSGPEEDPQDAAREHAVRADEAREADEEADHADE